MEAVLQQVFVKQGINLEKAKLLSAIHTESSLYGVYSHGINRVSQFIKHFQAGFININTEATLINSLGQIERWDGNAGSGVINATKCTSRAIELAKDNGLGLVALRNTNHWMRAGTYGWQAAKAGCIGIMFTNTQPNMPAWGGKNSRLGNNPLVIAIPRKAGHVVLDMAMSQFSFGKIHEYQLRGEKLPYPGGWDENEQLTDEPEKILNTEKSLPVGYWKGSALSMILDMLATLLSAGNSTAKISNKQIETCVSQVFICIDPSKFGDGELQESLLAEIINYTHDIESITGNANDASGKSKNDSSGANQQVYYPGERAIKTYRHNKAHGMQINETVWQDILALAKISE